RLLGKPVRPAPSGPDTVTHLAELKVPEKKSSSAQARDPPPACRGPTRRNLRRVVLGILFAVGIPFLLPIITLVMHAKLRARMRDLEGVVDLQQRSLGRLEALVEKLQKVEPKPAPPAPVVGPPPVAAPTPAATPPTPPPTKPVAPPPTPVAPPPVAPPPKPVAPAPKPVLPPPIPTAPQPPPAAPPPTPSTPPP